MTKYPKHNCEDFNSPGTCPACQFNVEEDARIEADIQHRKSARPYTGGKTVYAKDLFKHDKEFIAEMIQRRSLASVLEIIQDLTTEDAERMAPYIHGSRLSLAAAAIRKARIATEEVGLTDLH